MQLEIEQYELLGKFVEAHLSTSQENRGAFIASQTHGHPQATFIHSRAQGVNFRGSMSDAEILSHAGLLLKSHGSRGSSTFLVLPQAIRAFQEWKSAKARVFISYSHDSTEHSQAVLELANRLRAAGIDARLDQYEAAGGPEEGWPRWFLQQIESADAVLVVCSRGFERSVSEESGRGVLWEGSLVYQELYGSNLAAARFVPVVLTKAEIKFIPAELRAFTFYLLDTDAGFEELIRRLTGQPMVIRPALQAVRTLPEFSIRNLHGILVFLCHSSNDKAAVRELCRRLRSDGAKPWLDEEDLLAGQDWQEEIARAVSESHAVIVCLSPTATNRAGYFHKEIRFALDTLDRQPEGSIYLIPVKIVECGIPERLSHLHCISLEDDHGYDKLKKSLFARARQLRLDSVAYSG